MAERAAHLLMEEVYRGGVLDTVTQALAVTLMSLTPPDVSKVTLGDTFYSLPGVAKHLVNFGSL